MTCCLGIQQHTHAENTYVDLALINIELSGVVTTSTCGILSAEQDKYIQLGKVASKDLVAIGSQSKPIPIHFELKNCPPNGSVTITFNGPRNIVNTELLALDTVINQAQNVAIELRDQNKKRIALGKKSDTFNTDINGNISALFYANYIVTTAPAQAGIANANAQFSIQYD